jgi:hypothetical protein
VVFRRHTSDAAPCLLTILLILSMHALVLLMLLCLLQC